MMMTKKTGISVFLKSIIIGALVLLAITAPFIHKKYNTTNNIYSKEYKLHKAKYKPIIKNRDFVLTTLINDLENGNITIQDYVNSYHKVIGDSKLELQKYSTKKNELQKSYKFFGFNSERLFFQNIGVIVLSLIISLFFLNIVINPITEGLKKKLFIVIGCLFVFVSVYLLAWVLFAQRVFQGDFPEIWYTNILRFAPLLVTILSGFLFYYYNNIEKWYKGVINKLIVFIINSDKYIDSKEKENKHFIDSMDVLEEIAK